jgi:hypothetical protein
MKTAFRDNLHMSPKNKSQLNIINRIIEEYKKQGYKLTLRQLYYQLVSRDIIANKTSEYSKLGTLLVKGRMAGVVDWEAIEDRIRVPYKPSEWEDPAELIDACIQQYRKNRLENQDVYIELWVEKDALSGVLKRITSHYGINLMVNRGYSSCTAMHDSFERMLDAEGEGKNVVVLYLGDHDPSGLDMIRDIRDRLEEFGVSPKVVPIGLTMEQIKQFNPPPNPAKITDPRAKDYIKAHGAVSWEVDALNPDTLHKLVKENVEDRIDMTLFDEVIESEEEDKERLKQVRDKWRTEEVEK